MPIVRVERDSTEVLIHLLGCGFLSDDNRRALAREVIETKSSAPESADGSDLLMALGWRYYVLPPSVKGHKNHHWQHNKCIECFCKRRGSEKRFEYSTDNGKTWQAERPQCEEKTHARREGQRREHSGR
jgi:hypothetical protein